MREIKFRAWNRIENTMYYTHYKYSYHLHEFAKLKEFFGILDDVKDQFTDPMQYTGLKDNDGKEIYESDILEYKHTGEIVIVDWDSEIGCYIFDNENEKEQDVYICDMSLSNEYKIIGNKYENPELLEKQNGMDECNSNDM